MVLAYAIDSYVIQIQAVSSDCVEKHTSVDCVVVCVMRHDRSQSSFRPTRGIGFTHVLTCTTHVTAMLSWPVTIITPPLSGRSEVESSVLCRTRKMSSLCVCSSAQHRRGTSEGEARGCEHGGTHRAPLQRKVGGHHTHIAYPCTCHIDQK